MESDDRRWPEHCPDYEPPRDDDYSRHRPTVSVSDIVSSALKTLKTSSSLDDIADAAKVLADRGEHSELYRMANGERRRILGYNADMIMIGIEALATVGTDYSKGFLKDLLRHDERKSGIHGEADRMQADNRGELQDTYNVSFPNAPGKLRKHIEYSREGWQNDHKPSPVEQRVYAVLKQIQ